MTLTACSGGSSSGGSANSQGAQGQATVDASGFLDLGSASAIINDASDDSRPNKILPGSLDRVNRFRKKFFFNSGEFRKMSLDAEFDLDGLCQTSGGRAPHPVIEIYKNGQRGNALITGRTFEDTLDIEPHQKYEIAIWLQGLNCSGEAFAGEFSLKLDR
jgi:hypothetical protein